jgi:type IV pilus assembly protein PilQ
MKAGTGLPLVLAMVIAVSAIDAQTPKPQTARARVKMQKKDTTANASESPRMTFDFKDTDIRDVVRSISIAYGLNIVIDKDIAANVTIHLTDVPVLDGLRTVLGTHGLALLKEGDIYRIAKAEDKGKGAIAVSRRDTLNMDIDNMDVRDFIRDISAKTGINIIAEKNVEGRISGTLRNIDVENGIRALFEANGFITRYRGDIIMVSSKEKTEGPSVGGRPVSGPGGLMRRSSGQHQDLDVRVKDGKVSVDLNSADIGDALKQISDQSQLNFITYGDIRGEVNAKLDNVPLEKAIGLLMAGTNYSFAIKDSILLVGDRNSATPSGQALSTSVLLHLKHVKADNFMTVLPKSIPATNVQLVKEQNAVLITGTMDLISQVQEFIAQVDIPTPQIMIEAIVVEFSKDIGKEWGIKAGRGSSSDSTYKAGSESYIPNYWGSMSGRGVKNMISNVNSEIKKPLNGFQFGTMGFLPDDFWITLKALESESKARVMAQPRIATLNGNKASINVGVTRYFRLQGGTIENPFVRFQEIKSGIKLDITPWISQSGQVTVEISPEISNSMGDNKEGFPNVSTRSVNTTIRLNDGETIIIGGLIRAEDNKQIEKVPLLGSIPLLGKLFQSQGNQKSTSELVIYLTPHILKDVDIVEDLGRDLEKFKLRMNTNRETIELEKQGKPADKKTTPPAQ